MSSATRCYELVETAIGVQGDVADTLRWLDEFLAPSFNALRGRAPDFVVALSGDRAAYERAAATRPTRPCAQIGCFALDREVRHRETWTAAGASFLRDDRHGIVWRLHGTRIEVLAPGIKDWSRVEAMRVVREIAAATALVSPERLQLHAAALAIHGRAVLLAGPKGAGKTTVLCYLSATTGAQILANDRTLVSCAPDGDTVRGVPTIVSIRPGTFQLLGRRIVSVPPLARGVHLTLAEADAELTRHGSADGTERLRLSPPQLARELGVGLTAAAPLAAIIFPQPHAHPDGIEVEHLGPAAAIPRLREARFGLVCDQRAATIVEQFTGSHRAPDADASLIASLAAAHPCFVVKVGARQLSRPEAAQTVLATCLRG